MSDNRPTKEQSQTALAAAEHSRPPHYVAVLAAEVRALQAELKSQYDDAEGWNQRALAAEAVLARVESLAKEYDTQSQAELTSLLVFRLTHADAASDIRAALRGAP